MEQIKEMAGTALVPIEPAGPEATSALGVKLRAIRNRFIEEGGTLFCDEELEREIATDAGVFADTQRMPHAPCPKTCVGNACSD